MIRYEFRHFKRVLQTSRHRWRSKQMSRKAFFRRVYREDSKADEDWSGVCQRVPLDRPVFGESPSTRESLEREYLTATLKPLQYYAVETEVPEPQETGAVRMTHNTVYFQLVDAQTASQREKVMHTVQSADDITRSKHLLLHVIFCERWRPPEGEPDDDVIRVYSDQDPEWCQPAHIAPFENLQKHMVRFFSAVADPTHNCCMVLADPHQAVPRFALTDQRCPTLAIVWHLRNIGWTPAQRYVDHTVVPLPDTPQDFNRQKAT